MRDDTTMQIQSDETAVTLLAGVLQPERIPYPVFSLETMEFLAAVSARRNYTAYRKLPPSVFGAAGRILKS